MPLDSLLLDIRERAEEAGPRLLRVGQLRRRGVRACDAAVSTMLVLNAPLTARCDSQNYC